MANVAYNQPSALPTPKVQAAINTSVLVPIVLAVLAYFNIIIPPEISDQIVILVGAIASALPSIMAYLKRDKKPEAAIPLIKGEAETDNLWRSDGKG